MLKNPTTKRIAFYVALYSSLSVFVFVLLFQFIAPDWGKILSLVFLPVLVFAVSYYCTQFMVNQFVYERIKLIYRKIFDKKKIELPETSTDGVTMLEQVDSKVEEWTESKNKEIEDLKDLETYRKNYLGNVSHELKTPIFNIQGFLHTLIDGGIHDEEINKSYLKKAAKNVERLQTIVEDLERISKLESGQMVLDLQNFDIKKLTQEVLEEMELKAQQKNIKLTFKEGASQGWMVKADMGSVNQILTNLISNSIKYGKQNGSTKISFYDMDKIILIEVTDNGIGIPKHHTKHVFDRFYRVDKSRSREVGGSGLGLSIVKHLTEAHNQSVHLRSTEGSGSTFGFTLEKAY
jgi:two-component system, OmpR family, phosphate regulon sensor histidine kinase PhoR